jgi:hypothetical protein
MTALELQEGVIDSFQDFYSSKKILIHFLRREFFYGFSTFNVRYLFKKIVKDNHDYLDYLGKIKNKK